MDVSRDATSLVSLQTMSCNVVYPPSFSARLNCSLILLYGFLNENVEPAGRPSFSSRAVNSLELLHIAQDDEIASTISSPQKPPA